MPSRPIYKWIMRIVAVLVMLCALGQIANWEPFGVGALVRSGLSLIGITGAILLLCQRRLAMAFLLPWAGLQCVVWITDAGGPWFHQTLMLGYSDLVTTRTNNTITNQKGQGFNLAGVLWLALFTTMLLWRVFPQLKPLPAAPSWFPHRSLKCAAVTMIIIYSAWLFHLHIQMRDATMVITANVPGTEVYYQDQFLGYTPLVITPQQLAKWSLPVKPHHKLRIAQTDWTQRVILYDTGRATEAMLDFKSPFYAPRPKLIPTPWGMRHAIRNSFDESSTQQPISFWYENDDAAYLTIERLQKGPYKPGQTIDVRCRVVNPTDDAIGKLSTIRFMNWSFNRHWTRSDPPVGSKNKNLTTMPATWNNWPKGMTRTQDIPVILPSEPGFYTMMARFNLFADEKGQTSAMPTNSSNYQLIEVLEVNADE